MKKLIFLFLIIISISLSGCNLNSNHINSNTHSSSPFTMNNQNLPKQNLTFIKKNRQQIDIQVEVASTKQEREIGLMNRKKLPNKTGMLFVFDKSELVHFWMKNTLIPLDMIFIDENYKIEYIVQNVQPCFKTNSNLCERISSVSKIRYVVELPAGSTQKYNIQIKDTVQF